MYMKGFFHWKTDVKKRYYRKILGFYYLAIQEDELEGVDTEKMCIQELDFGYKSVSLDSRMLLPLSLRQYWYGAIPKCYTLLDMQPLDAAGIITLQNYPTLQLMGEGIMIGFLDTGIDYTIRYSVILTGQQELRGSGIRQFRMGIRRRAFCMEQSIPKKESMRLCIRKVRKN